MTIQGLTGPWYSGRWKNIHGAVGMLDMPLFKGGESHTHCKLCVPLHISACHLPPLHGTPAWHLVPQHGTEQGSPSPLNTGYKQSWQNANRSYATELHIMHASPLKAMGTVYQTQSQGYENTAYQAHSQGYGKLLLLVSQTPGCGSQTASIYPTDVLYNHPYPFWISN